MVYKNMAQRKFEGGEKSIISILRRDPFDTRKGTCIVSRLNGRVDSFNLTPLPVGIVSRFSLAATMFIRNEHTVRISPFAFKKKGENSRKMVSGSRIAADTGQLRFVKRVSRRAAFYCRYVTNPVARRLNFGQLVKLAK